MSRTLCFKNCGQYTISKWVSESSVFATAYWCVLDHTAKLLGRSTYLGSKHLDTSLLELVLFLLDQHLTCSCSLLSWVSADTLIKPQHSQFQLKKRFSDLLTTPLSHRSYWNISSGAVLNRSFLLPGQLFFKLLQLEKITLHLQLSLKQFEGVPVVHSCP